MSMQNDQDKRTHIWDLYGWSLFRFKINMTLKTQNSASNTVESVDTYVYIVIS